MEADNDIEQSQKQEQRQSSAPYETVCWGCGVRLILPSIVPAYKCGWCGAISNNDTQTRKEGWWLKCSYVLDRILVAIITFLVLLIICGGMWAVFPIMFTFFSFWFWVHLVITVLLSFNTLFNYWVAAYVQAGPIPHIAYGDAEYVGKGDLDGHRFCYICQKPKPPRAHHCRSCKTCVLDMDHHCPFIGNCVGAANHRSFLLFLFFSVISNLYVCVMSMATIAKVWSDRLKSGEIHLGGGNMNTMEVFISFLVAWLGNSMSSSVRAIGLVYLVALSLSVTIGVGLLLYQQIHHLYDGETFIDSLQQHNGIYKGIMPPIRGWKNLQRLFGHGHPLFWILPKIVVSQDIKLQ